MACNFPTDLGIVVGGGLAGVSACNTLVENGARTVLIDKSSFCGGNSTKATSGINGANTSSQRAKGITDSADIFTADTLKGGAKRPEVVKVLCGNSGRDVEWLIESFDLDLSLVARLGGHSQPRTHRGAERFPGMTITYALIQSVEKIAEASDLARIITKAKASRLLMDNGNCVGIEYEKGGEKFQEHGPVILCSGGFGADFTTDSLLAKYRPDLLHLPTTNGEHCTGDGIKMGEAIGAQSIDLEWVQVHPTGLVKEDDADAKIKFLAAEALRGVGGLVFNANGKRFANELGRRDYVTGEMWKNKAPFRLCLNEAASTEIHWHCKHYTGRGVMKFFENGAELAKNMGVPLQTLIDEHDQHYEAAKKTEKDPDGGSWPAYPSGKSWDARSGPTGSGKKFYHNVIPGSQVATEPFYVAIITPVIHYCMGGLEIDSRSRVLDQKSVPIPGLYAAGEVAGGVHGNNRLGGNSLLDCVVFGRVAAEDCASYMLGDARKKVDIKEIASRAPKPVVSEPPKTQAAGSAPVQEPTTEAAAAKKKKAPAKKAPEVASPKKGKLAAYKPEKWQGTLRGKFMKWFMARKSRQEAEKTAAQAKEAEEAARLEAFEEALVPPVAEDREAEVVDMAYFPMPGTHQGGGAQWTVFPWFQETQVNPLIQMKNWAADFWNGQDDAFRRKLYFSSALGGIFCVQVYYHHVLPTASYLQQQ
jgi:flavocytochrome c